MFDYAEMIKRAIEFFPVWSDIRKRSSKSVGGKLLDSVLRETLELNSAIQEYKDFYFLDKYEEKEDEVIAFVYAANVGKIEDIKKVEVTYNDKIYPLTLDIEEFYKNNYVYYENGLLYIKEKEIKDNFKTISININNDSYTYQLARTHVWNIFDEYAIFSGLERQENETNKQLRDRILYNTKNTPNNTEEGLKDSIIVELMSITDISKDDISISGITPENLVKPYKEYRNLLDLLSKMNKDVLKDKRWDLDKWQYPFKSISFLDNVWDDAISQYQNGIGSEDDLKVLIADGEKATDADITLYNKSLVRLEKYVQNNNIEKEISFKLKRYEDILNPLNAKYAIKASEAIDITNEEIELSVYETNNANESRKIEEIYKIGKDVSAIDNSKITDDKPYRLEFYSNGNYDSMKISKAKVIYKHKVTGEVIETKNLLKPAPGFSLNAQGDLVNTSIKKVVKTINNFNLCEGLTDKLNGIAIAENKNEGKGALNVSGLGLNLVRIDKEHQVAELPQSLVKHNKFAFWKGKELVFRYDFPQERTFEIKTQANILTFDLLEGEADVFVDVNNSVKREKIKAPFTWKYETQNNPEDIKVTVISNFPGPVKFSNFKYACSTIDISLKLGTLIKDTEGYRLPNFPINDLIVTMSSKTGVTPILKGIYIGGDLRQLRYKTEIIPSKTNTDRIIDITTNTTTDLLYVDAVGNTISKTEKYVPATSYKALKDGAWIRLDLSEYESVKKVTCPEASIHVNDESGKLYYDVVMKTNQVVHSINIDGVRNISAKVINLKDMIKMYFHNFNEMEDKVYASKICDGLIIADNNANSPRTLIIKVKSDIFKGINASRYKFTKMPVSLTSIFNSNSSQVHGTETNTPFESISLVPGGTKIYQAINEANVFAGEIRGIKMLNNFNPIMSTSSLMYYEITPFESKAKYNVKFASESDKLTSFDALNSWSLGSKDIAIKTPIDFLNTENYIQTIYDVKDTVLLNRYIKLKKSYKISENNEVFTNKFMIIPEEGCEVLYEKYSDTKNQSLIVQEEVIMEEDGFTKLSYSNVDEILYTGYAPYSGKNEILITEFDILKNEGIILWTDKKLIEQAKKVYIRYIIKEPIAIMLNEDALYKAIGYNVDAYEEIKRVRLLNVQDNFKYDLKQINEYSEADMVYTSCTSPSFRASGVDNILTFKKIADKDTVLVRTGYYYINGKEYYLYPTKETIKVKNDKYIQMDNVDIAGDEIFTFKETNNYVRNSEMLFRGINELYNYDATKSEIKGVSTLNAITACDSFNNWKTFGMKMSLENGKNQIGLGFNPTEVENAYAYLDITDSLSVEEDNYLSFWAEKTLSVYIGEENKYLGIDFPDSINIKLKHDIQYSDSVIRKALIKREENKKYYLVVKNHGVIDDIILSTNPNSISYHTKNIDLLKLDITEDFKIGQRYRVFIDDNKYIVDKGALIAKDGNIKMSSNIYWGLTPLKTCESKEDFSKCYTENIDINNDYICTSRGEGLIETAPIFIENPMTISRLIIKINEIGFDNMRGMKTQLLSSNTRDGDYIPINSFNDNYGHVYGDSLLKYIKLRILVPENKYINNFNLYVEYRSTEHNYPKVNIATSGFCITKIYDAQKSGDYKIRNINVSGLSNTNDVSIYVQSSRDDYSADVWHPWEKLELTSDWKIKNELMFYKTRFFRFKIVLKTSTAYIKIKNIDIEVM